MNRYTKENEKLIIREYLKVRSCCKVQDITGFPKSSVRNILLKNNIDRREIGSHKRKYSFNVKFFDILDKSSAYWLGFLYADGSVCNNVLEINLSRRDKNHLYRFLKSIKSNHPVGDYESFNKKTNKKYEISKISIYSKELCNKLISLGCVERKSMILEFPCFIKDSLLPEFLRGYFDGDGGVNSKLRRFNIVSTKQFVQEYIKTLRKMEPRLTFGKITKNAISDVYSFSIFGRKNIPLVYRILYPPYCKLFLERKRNEFIKATKS